MRFGGVIVCGGESKRMGAAKPWLPFGDQALLDRVVQTLAGVVHPVVVAAASGQMLPPLKEDASLAYDRAPGRGPLEGIAVGLAAFEGRAEAAFLCACDAALLTPAVVQRVCDLLGDHDAVVPVVAGYRQTFVSVVRTSVLATVEAMLSAGERKTHHLFDRVTTRFLAEGEIRAVDPEMTSLRAMNTPEEYLAALAIAGIPLPDEATLQKLFATLP